MPPPLRPTRISPTTVVVPRGGPLVITPRDAPVIVSPPSAGDPKSRALALIDEVHAIKHQMSASAYRLGVVLKALSAPPMIAALGCTNFDDVLLAHDLPSRMTALKYITLAEHFDEPEATAIGAEKGYALVRYGRALARPEAPTALLARNVKLAGVPLRDASTAEILRAVRDLMEKQREGAAAEDDTADEADKAVRRLGAKLRKAGAPGAKLRRVRRGSAWRVLIELDADEAAALASRV
ncbi:MAG: hypothetical protein J0L92_23625 [Deltaproteobacteria bacterium]|nr:hypothetical protein [Deltaproteobacteria bacterium]